MNTTRTFLSIAMIASLMLVGCGNGHDDHATHGNDDHQAHEHDEDHSHDHDHNGDNGQTLADRALGQASYYTCPMHPQIVRDEPGRCPICGMNLVERQRGESDEVAVDLSPGVLQTMNLRTTEVRRSRLFRRIDTIGRIEVDPSGLSLIHPRVEGWIGELDVNAIGETIAQGQRLFTLYSAELVNTQEEYLQALRSGRDSMTQAARQRLEVLDMQARVIDRLERDRQVMTWVPWYAERDGYVSDMDVRRGMFVTPGTEILRIADPGTVWLIADVFGGQIDWLAGDQIVQIQRASHPEERLRGRVDYIYPELSPQTRTARVRVVLDNPNGTLRPGDWAGVTIFGGPKENLLIVPTEAIIRTGTEERVVIRESEGRFSIREIHAGLESGSYTEILHGLEEGEVVVTSGQFLIDSEASLRAGHDRMGGQHDH
jgi:membrane fusion protein, copper/silver efflux system